MGNKSPCGAGLAAAAKKADAPRQKTRMKSKYVISNQAKGDEDEEGQPEEHLEEHKDQGVKMSPEIKELVMKGLKQDSLCALLEEAEINYVLQAMQHFTFRPHDPVVKQGEVGTTFFVVEEGSLSVSVNAKQTNTLVRGQSFGGVALRYKCPRTASVIAQSKATCWGANGDVFHKAMQANAQRQYKDNRKIIDGIQLFDSLSSKQKDIIAEGIFLQRFEAGHRVLTEGQPATGLNYVKTGQLAAYKGGQVRQDGVFSGGKEEAKLRAGDLLGEKALVNGAPNHHTVIAEGVVEVLCISTQHLSDILGKNVGVELEKSFLLVGVRQSPSLSQLTVDQQKRIVEAMTVRSLHAGEKIPEGLRFAIVIQGTLAGMHSGKQVSLARGQWYELEGGEAAFTQPVAKTEGCKVGMVLPEGFSQALRPALIAQSRSRTDLDAADYTTKVRIIKSVHVFRQLSHEQVDLLVRAFKVQEYKKGDIIIKQGDAGKEFYVMASGEVDAYVMEGRNKKVLRTMLKNSTFGERSLLMAEPRTATVEVTSEKAEIWSLDDNSFSQIVKGKMKAQLIERVKLQETNVALKDLQHVKVIGVGATGTVRLVQHKTTKTRYALKRVRKNKRGKIPKEVEHERDLLKENDHPFVMYMVKSFETPKSVYMLTELNTGGELHAAIRKLPAFLPLAMAQFYTGTIALVLEELYERNIVYRDLKPENVMLDQQGYLKLVDFGIAKKLDEKNNQTFTIIGTPHYMAPEVLLGRGYGLEVDIWSMGVLLYEFVCGRLPFADDRDDPSEVCQAVLKATLNFPHRYKDTKGQVLIKGLLCRQRKKRMGAGISGFDEIKKCEWFKQGVSGDIFEKILGRELDAPHVPRGENYCDPSDILDVTLSDAGELA